MRFLYDWTCSKQGCSGEVSLGNLGLGKGVLEDLNPIVHLGGGGQILMATKSHAILWVIPVMLIMQMFSLFVHGRVIYVDDDAAGAGHGTSWIDAYPCLQDALADAVRGDEIRVGQGIYQPDRRFAWGRVHRVAASGDRTATFQLRNGVTVKGAYAGLGETDPNLRDVTVYQTILSGDLIGNDIYPGDPCDLLTEPTRSENSYHVVTGSGTDATAVLDGFIITAGNANYPDPFSPYVYGGGMVNEEGSPFVNNCIFIENSANDSGAAVNNQNSHPILQNCNFIQNYTEWDGGGLFNYMSSPQVKDCNFEDNRAYGSGGGMANYENSHPTLTNCVFKSNSTGNIGAGGGVSNGNGCNPELEGCTFIRNWAFWGGGGVDNNRDYGIPAKYIDCDFIENIGQKSGGGMSNDDSSPIITRCEFIGNRTNAMGGAIISGGNNSQPVITYCVFNGNYASNGGAIHNSFGVRAKIANCTFTGNTVSWIGGAIFDSNSVMELTNCLIQGNLADGGGAMFFDNSVGSAVSNCTFAGNAARFKGDVVLCGGWAGPSRVGFTNCIIWDSYSETEIWNNDGSIIELSYSNRQGGQVGIYDPYNAVVWGNGNMYAPPLFVSPGHWGRVDDPNVAVEPNDPNAVWIDGDYHLKSQTGRWDSNHKSWVTDNVTSPCIDTGDPNCVVSGEDTDLDGHPRILGARIDMGAYEHQSEASVEPNLVTKGPAPNSVKSLYIYEDRIGESGLLIEVANLQMWVPKRYEEYSRMIFEYFKDGYRTMSAIFGGHDMAVKFSIEHYPPGSSYTWGGTDGQGTIRYSYTNLEDNSPEWNLYNIPHVVGYYEEMAHCFIRDIGIRGEVSVGYYETLGMMIGQEITLRTAWNPYVENLIESNRRQNADTTGYYLLNDGGCNVQENICLTRVLAYVFQTEVIDTYGWDSLTAAFGEVIRDGYPLRDYDCNHTWGGFLSHVERVTGADLGAVFGAVYGLPWMLWTEEPGYESDGVKQIGTGQYRFRIRILDIQGDQPVDVRLHLYGDLMASVTTHDMLAAGGDLETGWLYKVNLQIEDPKGFQYAFSANDGMHHVFQAIGEPTVKQPLE